MSVIHGQRVVVTYASSPVFLSTDHWKQAYAALLCQFPLRNLHWKSAFRSTIQTIQELDVNLVPLESLRDEHTSQISQLLDKPLLNIYLVICEVNAARFTVSLALTGDAKDNDTYKNTVKKQIKDWHTSVSQRKNQEWLIVHIVRPDGKSTQGRIFQVKASVLDKIKADFNVDKKDRCVQLVYSTDYENPAAWADLINKLKEGILSAFDVAFCQREEEVKRSEGQRHMPGWNFCTFFILKESLATALEGMNLYEDALQQYNELESSFFRVLREKNLSWFGALISPEAQDDSAPLLSITKKPYRNLILDNSISIFDFRIYLLARQCALLSKLGKVVEICRKAVAFLGGFGRRLRELEDTLPHFFVESWTYSSALSVVESCDTWASNIELSKPVAARFNAVKGELLELAQQQLDIIGIRAGHLPSRPPFSIALPIPNPSSDQPQRERSSQKLSQADLVTALENKEAFYDLYVNVINRAIELYATAGRRKFALKLHGNLAALDLIRGRLPNAFETYKSLPAHYAPHGWTSLESFMRMQALTIHASAEKTKDEEWLHIVLDFLKSYVEDMGQELLMEVNDHISYVAKLVATLRNAVEALQSDFLHPDHPALSVYVADNNVRLTDSQDGALLDVIVRNRLPCDIAIDEVFAVLVGFEGTQLTFSEKAPRLVPGTNKLTLFCPSSTAGIFALQTSRIRLSRLVFEWKDSRLLAITKGAKLKEIPSLVRVPKDIRALDVRIRPPPCIEVGVPAKVMVTLQSGRNDVSYATIKLSTPSGIQFKFLEAKLEDEMSAKFSVTEDAITLFDIPKEKTVIVSLPHSDASSYHTLRINVALEYVVAGQPEVTRKLNFARFVATSLPMSVNVEDFFRGTRLFTRFTLSTTSHQHVRVQSAQLETSRQDEASVKVTTCQPQRPTIVTITPSQSGKFIFQLDSARGQATEPLKLKITYRMLREEVESLIDIAMEMVVAESPHLRPQRELLIDKMVEALSNDADWIELYGVTGELIVPDIPDQTGDVAIGLRHLKEILGREKTGNLVSGGWREIVIPVDVPRMHILAAARLHVLASPSSAGSSTHGSVPLFAGQPISASVIVTTSFHWAPIEDTNTQSCPLRYDVEDMTGDWLVSGCKRGDFEAKDGTTFTVPITLIALHHGELSLPKIGITALPLTGETRMVSAFMPSCETYQMHGAEKVLVLPRGGRSTFVVDMGHEVSVN